jgi:transcription initiation factor TFIID subunit 10
MAAPTAWQEEAQKENANIEKFLKGMSEYPPPIPDAVIMRILAEAGLATSDARVHRTLNVACQKFIDDVLQDCAANAKRRVKRNKSGGSKKGLDLQVSDLKVALENRSIHVHRPEFIVSIPKTGHD